MTTAYANNVLVSTQWVQDHMNDQGVRLVEVDVDTSAYEQGHVPGAVGWNWRTQLQDFPSRDVATKASFEKLCGQAGIDDNTTIVFYGDNNNWFAAWAYWLATYYGHPRAHLKLMDGGRAKWLAENRSRTTDAPRVSAKTYTAKQPDPSVRALRDAVLHAVNAKSAALVDVRSPREYSGELLAPENLPQEGAQRGGHIPGAQNIPWGSVVNQDGTFKPRAELDALYRGKGVTPDKPVIAYCRIGERSSHSWFVLRELLGYANVRNYDGSWTEWGSSVGVPIEK